MAFSYDSSLSSDRDLVRFNLGDTVAASGPRPGGSNYADGEIDYHLTQVSSLTYGWRLVVGQLLRTLANEWTMHARNIAIDGYREDATATGAAYRDRAAEWEASINSNGALTAAMSGVIAVTRQDAYSSDIASNTVTT